jgi:UrcA family protein
MSLGDYERLTEEEMTMNTIRTKLYAAICVLFGSAAVGAPWTSAQASIPNPASRTVKFADLDIHTAEGAKVLYHRIQVAAHEVCEPVARDAILRQAVPSCIATAIDNAVKKVDAPYLTALRYGDGSLRLASK